MLNLFATMYFMAGVVFVVFFTVEGGRGALGIVLVVSHLNLKVLNYQKNLKHLNGSPPSVPVVIIPLRNNRSEG